MKNTGIMRKVDELGRVVIPIDIRNSLNIKENDFMEVYTENDMIIFRKYLTKGIGKRIDRIGRIHIPGEIRSKFDIKINDLMEIYIKDEIVILKKYFQNCIFCENDKDLINFNNKSLCQDCLKKIKKMKIKVM